MSETTQQPIEEPRQRVGGFGIWYGVTAGIVFWAIHLVSMAAITPYVCHSGRGWWYHVLSVGTLIPTLVAIIPSWAAWRSDEGGGGVPFLGAMGILLSLIFGVAIIAEWVPVFIVDACAA